MNNEVIDKMPLIIENAEFNDVLRDPKRNALQTAMFLEKGVEDFSLPGYAVQHGYRLVKSKQGEQYRLITTDIEPITVYAVKLVHLSDIVFSRNTCTQVMVWRSPFGQHRKAITGIAAIFFNYFLDTYSIVVSDKEQTLDGKRFWEDRIGDALVNPAMHVYVSKGDEGDRDGIRPLVRIETYQEFNDYWEGFCWGKDPEVHPLRLIVISKEWLI